MIVAFSKIDCTFIQNRFLMKFILLFYSLFLSFFIGRTQEISWGDIENQSGSIHKTIPIDSNKFITVRYFSRKHSASFIVEKYIGFEKVSSQKIRTTAQKRIATFRGAEWINNQLVVFVSNRSEGEEKLYIKLYDKDFNLIEDRQVASFQLDRKRREGVFHYQISENKKFVGFFWNLEGRKDLQHKYGFKIYSSDWLLHHEGEYEVSLPSELSKIHSSHLSNRGDFFLCVSEYKNAFSRSAVFKKHTFKSLHIYHIAEGDGLFDYEIELKNKTINTVGLSSADTNLFTVTGVYKDSLSKGINGVFLSKINLEQKEIVTLKTDAFDSELISNSWSEKERNILQRKQGKKGKEEGLMNYEMRNIVFMEDGSVFCTMEQYFVDKQMEYSNQMGGGSYSIDYYHFNDIICYKIGTNHKIDWIHRIDKRQISIDDYGLYSGFYAIETDSIYTLFFNDHIMNYQENGDWASNPTTLSYSTTKNSNVFAQVNINMNSGKIQRKIISSRFKSGVILLPRDFSRFKNEVLMVGGFRRKERFGKFNTSLPLK